MFTRMTDGARRLHTTFSLSHVVDRFRRRWVDGWIFFLLFSLDARCGGWMGRSCGGHAFLFFFLSLGVRMGLWRCVFLATLG